MSARTTRTATALVAAFGIAATMVAAAPASLAATADGACDVIASTDPADAARVQVDAFGALKDLRVDVRTPGTTKVLASAGGFESAARPGFGVRHRSAALPALAALGRYDLDVRYTDAAGKSVSCADSGELRYLPHPALTLTPPSEPVSLEKPTANLTGKLVVRDPRTRAETPLKGRKVLLKFVGGLDEEIPKAAVTENDGTFSTTFTYTSRNTSTAVKAEAAGAAPATTVVPVEKRKVVVTLSGPSSLAPGYGSRFSIAGKVFYQGGDGTLHPLADSNLLSEREPCEVWVPGVGYKCGWFGTSGEGPDFTWSRYTLHGDGVLTVTHGPGALIDSVSPAKVTVKVDRTLAFLNMKAIKDPQGRLTIQGSTRLGYGTNTERDPYLIQHSADGKTGWKTYKTMAHWRTGPINRTLEPGTFPAGGFWRVHFAGSKQLEPGTSPNLTVVNP
ncbi:hypothetical protein OHA37_27390 [Streptomyces sp. NBC_00335]|uniref:hypothetical protein n=1 Tax=unclassified Streptomyces TaxID=2593676 RepID=UPI002253D0DB|nr:MULTISPECIES: hypothetical protein [unclassified Streptomyces]MCX5407574.1 hypothetical protein [Streptomyces sp. NBC_00086]